MTCKGTVRGNAVILEEGVVLPEGADVEVRVMPIAAELSATEAEKDNASKRLFSMNLPVADWPQMEEEIIREAAR